MHGRYLYNKISRRILLIDCVIFSGSLAFAWMIRSQFEWFRFQLVYAALLFPPVIFLRVFLNIIFDHYRVNFRTLGNADILRLLTHQLIPSAILCALRFLSPLPNLRMPLSMIAIEYVFSMFGTVSIRLVAHSILIRRKAERIGYRARMLLWLEPEHRDEVDIRRISSNLNVEFVGILSSNPMFWDTYVDGIRILGDESVLRDVVANDDRICAVCLVRMDAIQLRRLKRLREDSKNLSMQLATLQSDEIVQVR